MKKAFSFSFCIGAPSLASQELPTTAPNMNKTTALAPLVNIIGKKVHTLYI
jgi:hypothetical protein